MVPAVLGNGGVLVFCRESMHLADLTGREFRRYASSAQLLKDLGPGTMAGVKRHLIVEKIAALEGYKKVYALFSKSGFTDRVRDMGRLSTDIILVHGDRVI